MRQRHAQRILQVLPHLRIRSGGAMDERGTESRERVCFCWLEVTMRAWAGGGSVHDRSGRARRHLLERDLVRVTIG